MSIERRGSSFEVSRTNGYYDLQKLRSTHREIIRLDATGQFSGKEIAEHLGVTPQMVYYTLNSEMGREMRSALQHEADLSTLDVMHQIRSMAPVAAEQLENMLVRDDTSDTVRTRIAQDILDRAGYGATHKVDVTHQKRATTEIIAEAKKRAQENGYLQEAKIVDEQTRNGEEGEAEGEV